MKVSFFLVLLSNIIFFLWEFNSVRQQPQKIPQNSEEKQIFLLSELANQEVEKNRVSKIKDTELAGLANSHPVEQFGGQTELNSEVSALSGAAEVQQSIAIIEQLKQPVMDGLALIQVIDDKGDTEIDANSDLVGVMVNTAEIELNTKLIRTQSELAYKQADLKQNEICYQAGPFLSEQRLVDWIESNQLDPNWVVRDNQDIKNITGYLVYYPQAETFSASKEHILLLKNKGVSDYWLFRKGELKGKISLGLFVKQRRALALQQNFIATGIAAEIMTRYKTESLWYAKISSENGITIERMTHLEKQALLACGNI